MGMAVYVLHELKIDFSSLEQYEPGKPTILLDDEGKEWARFALDRREPVPLEDIPQQVIQAFIAAEDHTFFSHTGLSLRGIVRSLLVNLYHGKRLQGASTITQQLVRLLFLDTGRTYQRKIKEQLLALIVERQFSKEQILQTYLNHVYFGSGIYGVQSASQRFWGVPIREVTIEQAATLAAVVKGARYYSPLLSPAAAFKRRNVVLHSMMELGYLGAEEYQEVKQKPLALYDETTDTLAPHAKEWLRLFLEQLIGRQALYTGGYVVATTINQRAQRAAQQAFSKQIAHLRKTMRPSVDGALMCIEVKSGAIKAEVGGMSFAESQFNRAEQAKRQLGSIFKPIVYAAAMQAGKTFADTCLDEPLSIGFGKQIWQPHNYNRKCEGLMTLAHALSRSNNIVTIKTLLEVGVQQVIDLARACRLPENMPPYPSLSLGCIDVTLRQALGFFNVFANNGVYVQPYMVRWVKDTWGKKIWQVTVERERVLSPIVSGQVAKVLSLGIERARKRFPHQWISCEAIGKTGTTNESRTCWFTGSTPDYTTALYIGLDDNRSLGNNIYAVNTALPIWLGLHRALPIQTQRFSCDPVLKEIYIDSKTGQRYTHCASDQIIPIYVRA